MEVFNAFMEAYGMEIISAILTAIAGVLGVALKRLATKYINSETKQNVAKTVVQAVEQIYKDLHGEDKLNKAMETMAAMLGEQGITVTDLEMRMLLESAVGEFNNVFSGKKTTTKKATAEKEK